MESVTIVIYAVPKQAVKQTFLVPVVTSVTVLWVFFQYKLESVTMVISAVPKQAVEQTFVVPVITSVIVLCVGFQYKITALLSPWGSSFGMDEHVYTKVDCNVHYPKEDFWCLW